MKIFYINYYNGECGEIVAFTNKNKAQSKKKKLQEDGLDEWPLEIETAEFDISKEGLISAFKSGAQFVIK